MLSQNIKNFIDYFQDKKTHKSMSEILGDIKIYFIDIGAAGSIHPRWNSISKFLNYYGFEPDKRSYNLLINKKNNCHNYKIFNIGIWDKEDEIEINLCKKPWVSSYYLPNDDFIKRFSQKERFEIVGKEKIKTKKLDDLDIQEQDFIKIDIQGGELSVLKGSEKILTNCIGLELEIEFLEIYEKQPLFGDITSYLKERNFEFIDFVSLNRWERNKYESFGQTTFGDALFLRTPEFLLSNFKNDEAIIRKFIAIYILYNRFDLIDIVIKSIECENIIEIEKIYKLKKSIEILRKRHLKIRSYRNLFNKIIRLIDKNNSVHLFN